ncbi:hypothetical protein CTH30272_02690 [Allocatenococcus thiocycli]|nr:hypothetical protein CTH30272_02682 [Catenococcus thiocycli]CAH0530106.1 hypothetical protein CTH30272_02683 [Catenococcus thiocycli]CAH0530120.1 hypothetical protein CTH30272_02690 [Catenococcus thiocycli]
MSNKNSFGTQRKINLREIIEDTVSRFIKTRESDKKQKIKTDEEKRLGTSTKNKLRNDGRKNESNKITLTTMNGYLTKVRKAIVETGYKHHFFEKKITALVKKNPRFEKSLNDLLKLDCLAATKAKNELVIELRKLAKKDREGKKIESLANALSGVQVVPVAISALKLDELEKQQMSEHNDGVINRTQSSKVKLDADSVNNLLIKLFESDNPHDLALGVAMATGRRQIEVLIQGEFKKVGEFEIAFSGQAKEKNAGGAYNITTLVSADKILQAIEKLRESPQVKKIMDVMEQAEKSNDFYTKNETFNNYSRAFTTAATSTLSELGEKPSGWTFKDSRAIYANVAFKLDEAHRIANGLDVIDSALFFEQELGHKDKESQHNYKSFYVVGDVNRITRKLEKKVLNDLAKEESKNKASRVEQIKELANDPAITNEKLESVIEKIIPFVENDPAIEITTTFLRKEVKGKATRLSKVLAVLKDKGLDKL